MAITTVYTYPLNGSARDFSIPFEYLARRFVSVTLIGTDRKELSITTDFRFTSKTSIQTTKAWSQADGYELIEIRRNTSVSDRLVDFADGSILRAYELNIAQVQTLHVAEEARNMVADTIGVDNDGMLDARARRIVNVADAIEPGDAVTLRQQATWAGSALNSSNAAKLSETNSKASENAAKLSETNSKASENAAKLSETNSKASENAAKLSETNSKASENAAKLSETNSKASENAAKLSETNSANSASEAAGYAAGVNLPSASGNGGKTLIQSPSEAGLIYVPYYGGTFRNRLINGDMRINQRGFNGVWTGLAEGAYGYDRWKRSGSNIQQVIEAGNFRPSTVHTLSGSGVATQQITSPASGHWTITVPNTALNVQVEEGPIATPFEFRHLGCELSLCQRYFWRGTPNAGHNAPTNYYPNIFQPIVVMFPVTMRAVPDLSMEVSGWTFVNCYPTEFTLPSRDGGRFGVVVQAAGQQGYWTTNGTGYLQASAEL
ncbi:phage tail fiber protein [Stutzerimonas stutzeri]|uniref:phage tail fiber domain-containing protein n=1 Tax=Stutzerimonas stutzeri TaxID=316 RepID=UPI0030A13024